MIRRIILFALCIAFSLPSESMPLQARPMVVVSKPKVVYFKISVFPPPKYDVPYEGELSIRLYSSMEDMRGACPNGHNVLACSKVTVDHKRCEIDALTETAAKRAGLNYAFTLRHELAHCNGWRHPMVTKEDQGRFHAGSMWAEAEGAKWIREDTKIAMPKLPASTRILPASPPVVCVTPDWKPEPCAKRQEGAWAYSRSF
jgi:hypothetical protein